MPSATLPRRGLRLAFVALFWLGSAQAFSSAPGFFSPSSAASLGGVKRAHSARGCAVSLGMTLDMFEKDCVVYALPPALRDATGKGFGLGGVMEIMGGGAWVQPLCFREEGSRELYTDSREEAVEVAEDGLVRIVDTYPSQRPIPSLGGGIGYGADAVDCWELQEDVGADVSVPIEDTGMGFHQKGWS
ncbi:hypothetical protein T484DRAFT_1969022 [Baffinella frigidus]|nr:hypothetical protein T484DRAFT_1969022 [Cryptophyta sp. CCMP2293]|mmetsp:Transcript_6642/g.15965  ORF Transcript_6642/g.15965 Transcript_6642/m.15965 type:complete len:188 (-) Transcript_6642:111-674(-)